MTAKFEHPIRRALLFALLLALACGEASPDQEFLWVDTFEDVCDDGLPCGWQRIDGAATDASFVETSFHPGEHGLRLDGTVTVRGPENDAGPVIFNLGSLEARFIARCDEGASIEILVGLRELTSDGLDTGRVDMTMPARVFPPTTWSAEPDSTVITSESAFVDGGLGSPPNTGTLQVTSVSLTKSGPGSCEIAELIIDDTGSATRLVSDGC